MNWHYSRAAGDGSTLDDDTEGSGDFKAWEAKFRCTNLRTAKKHSVGQWGFNLSFYRQDAAKRQTAGIKFTHRPKIRVFTPQGQLVAPIHVKLGMANWHLGPLGCAKFYLSWRRGWECGPKIWKIYTFFVNSRLACANSLTDFYKF